MICPTCRYEYPGGIVVCPDCDESLVAQLRPTAGAAAIPDDTWVGVCALIGTITVELAKGALDSNNIPSLVVSKGFAPSEPVKMATDGLASLVGHAEILLVPRQYRDDASIILEAVLGEDFLQFE